MSDNSLIGTIPSSVGSLSVLNALLVHTNSLALLHIQIFFGVGYFYIYELYDNLCCRSVLLNYALLRLWINLIFQVIMELVVMLLPQQPI